MDNKIISEYPLLVLPTLAVEIGLNEAIFLQQLHFWLLKSDKVINNRKWIYNSYPEWQKQFPFWSIDTIKRTIRKLEKANYLNSSKFNKLKIDRTKWYSINYGKLSKIDNFQPTIGASCPHQEHNLHPPIPETTTETTTYNIKKEKIYKKEKRSLTLPADFKPNESLVEWAKSVGVRDPVAETEQFKDHHAARGSKFVKWDLAWRTWMRNAVKFDKTNKPAEAVGSSIWNNLLGS